MRRETVIRSLILYLGEKGECEQRKLAEGPFLSERSIQNIHTTK